MADPDSDAGDGPEPDGGDDPEPDGGDDRVQRIAAELAATAELPVERTASRWIGEAEAVAEDAATADLDPAVCRERIAHVVELLSNVDDTGDDRADEHVQRARELAASVVPNESDRGIDESDRATDW